MALTNRLGVLLSGLAMATAIAAQNLTADMIMSMGNNSFFTRWRPYSHSISPAGWMNDPCGPMYDPTYRTLPYSISIAYESLRLGYSSSVTIQRTVNSLTNSGNISWGHATSPDLITRTDVDHSPGNHSGMSAWQNNIAQSFGTTNFSSNHHTPSQYNHLGIWSGTALPINITGQDDGTITAFYTSISRLSLSWDTTYPIGAESQSLAYSYDGGITWEPYAGNPVILTSPPGWFITGFRDPFLFPSTQFDKFLNYTSPHYYVLLGSGINQTGPRAPLYSAPQTNLSQWTFLGALWEPALNSSLGDSNQTGFYGQQWEVPNIIDLDGYWYVSSGINGGSQTYRSFWNVGNGTARSNGSILFTPMAGGSPDWGNLYAITSFNDTKNNRRIQIGWSYDDTSGFSDRQRGGNGVHGLPRVLYNPFTPNVQRPTPSDAPEYTTVYYDPASKTIGVDGTYSSLINQFLNTTYSRYFTPYILLSNSSTGPEIQNRTEAIHMRIFVDGSLVEVNVNERFWLTSRIFPSSVDSVNFGVFAAQGVQTYYTRIEGWIGLANVWPQRPLNSSSPLKWDTAAQTGNYTWWDGD